jgi:undecaprenyl-diphosphatase
MLAMTLKLDHFVRAWIVMHRWPPLNGVMWGLSVVGRGGLVWIAIAGLLGAAGRTEWRGLIQLALALLLTSTVIDHAVKPLVGRDRPFVSFPAAAVIGGRPDDSSFPSGHSGNAAAGAFVLSRLAPGGQLAWWTLALAIAYSRVYVGVHYPLDVLCGALVGLNCAMLIVLTTNRYLRR